MLISDADSPFCVVWINACVLFVDAPLGGAKQSSSSSSVSSSSVSSSVFVCSRKTKMAAPPKGRVVSFHLDLSSLLIFRVRFVLHYWSKWNHVCQRADGDVLVVNTVFTRVIVLDTPSCGACHRQAKSLAVAFDGYSLFCQCYERFKEHSHSHSPVSINLWLTDSLPFRLLRTCTSHMKISRG